MRALLKVHSTHAQRQPLITNGVFSTRHALPSTPLQNIKHKAVCLVCGTLVAVLKYYTLNRHDTSKLKRVSCVAKLNCKPLTDFEQNASHPKRLSSVKFCISSQNRQKKKKKSKVFCDGEFTRKCLLDSFALIRPQKKRTFEKVPLGSSSTVAGKWELPLKNTEADFDRFPLTSTESCHVRDTIQLLIF